MKINSKDFRIQEGHEVDLKKWPTKVEPVYKSKEQYKKLLDEHVSHLSSQQQLLYASNRYAVLLIFQAMDAAGKDGVISHVMSGVNPQGCQVFSFKHPSAVELEHDFLWRTTRDLPERGPDRHLQSILLRGGFDRPRAPGDSAQRRVARRAARQEGGLARPLSFDYEFGKTSPCKRYPHHQVLPSPLQGRAAQALPGAYR